MENLQICHDKDLKAMSGSKNKRGKQTYVGLLLLLYNN